VVCQLLDAGADPLVTVGGQTAMDLAHAFEQTGLFNLLTAAVESRSLLSDAPDDTNKVAA